MTTSRITDEAVWVAARTYNEFIRTRPSHPDAIHAALEAAEPHLAGATPILDLHAIEDAIRDEFMRFGGEEIADDARRAANAVLAVIAGAR